MLEIFLGRPEIQWWLRNPPRKEWSFSVTYKDVHGDGTNMYPDFLVIRKEKTGIVVDIVEPHRMDDGDTARKLLGLARPRGIRRSTRGPLRPDPGCRKDE